MASPQSTATPPLSATSRPDEAHARAYAGYVITTTPIRVVFLLFYFEAWDSLDEVYRRMAADPGFDPIVVTIPRKLTGDEDFGDEHKVSAFLEERGIPHERFAYTDDAVGLARLKSLHPDYVFLNYPWQRNYQESYRVESLVTFTRVCYVPYFSLYLVNEPGVDGVAPHQYTQTTHQLAHLLFLQDGSVVDALNELEPGNSRVRLTGTPKIDALIRAGSEAEPLWPIERSLPSGETPFRLLWGPHHSYGQRWLNFGVFTETCEAMLQWAERHADVDIVLRPHPFMWGTLVDRDLMTPEQVASWRARWDALSNTAVDVNSSYPRLFVGADALFTDGISFIAEYPLVTGKPAIFWEKPDHWAFTPLGVLAADTTLRVTNMTEFDEAVAAVRSHTAADRSSQIAALRDTVSPHPGQAARLIVDAVRADHQAD